LKSSETGEMHDLVNLQKTVTTQLNDRLSVRLYADCRPNYLETSQLQKGLVLVLDGEELIEEGVGFGVPVVKYSDKTYFSSTAEVESQITPPSCNLRKTFILDAISRKKIGKSAYIDDRVYSSIRKKFEKLYLEHKKLSPLFNNLMELRDIAKIKTEFVKVKPRGQVTVDYQFQASGINVKVDFSGLNLAGCREVLIENEQGSTMFDSYVDSNGLKLFGSRIGGWDKVTAKEATMLNSLRQVTFSLQSVRGAAMFRGWEKTKNRFSWTGLNYSLQPNNGTFNYTIKLSSRNQKGKLGL
jgi:hypothetical protein